MHPISTHESNAKLLTDLKSGNPVFYPISQTKSAKEVLTHLPISHADLITASQRLQRWSEALTILFPQLQANQLQSNKGLIESPLLTLNNPESVTGVAIQGKTLIKADHLLPIAGSIKARGGIYEVLAFAEKVGIEQGLITENDDLTKLVTPNAKALFANYRVGVGSTGNLGLSIGLMSAALGFQAIVHMSADAKAWKKALLRQHGVTVIEHTGDYATAVEAGRQAILDEKNAHFVDDENSLDLFLGYAVAGLRLQQQLQTIGIVVDKDHPLLVYLPCGVGGAPGGITWGLKQVFGDNVHCFFAEPTASPAFLVRCLSDSPVSVYDFGLINQTEADGLAVAQASELVYELVGELIDGCYTVQDNELFPILTALKDFENLQVEPSATAGFLAPKRLQASLQDKGILDNPNATHLFWTTGGSFLPITEYKEFYQRGESTY